MTAPDPTGLNALTHLIIGSAFTVSRVLGVGFLEKVYENALMHELRKCGMHAAQQRAVSVTYDGVAVGTYVAYLVVENLVMVELKATRALGAAHCAQCINYLRASDLRLCLLLNFGRARLEVRRIVHAAQPSRA